MRLQSFVLCLLATSATAQDWAVRSGDRLLDAAEVADLTVGQTLTFYDDGRSMFSAGGAYSYTYASGDSAFGRFEIDDDGMVCIAFRNGFSRCDRYVENGSRIVMLTQKGERFPLRGDP